MRIKTLSIFFIVMLDFLSLSAQDKVFEQTVKKLKQHVFSGDTALYNEKKICFFGIGNNGNIQIATREEKDTLQFNLLLLHPLQIDSTNEYNQYGMGLYGRSIDLFVDETSSSHEFNDKGEIVMTRVMLPVFELKFEDKKAAKATADLLVLLRTYCKLDDKAYRRFRK